jgi:diguanylate cyclase (GGDEF)-like protein
MASAASGDPRRSHIAALILGFAAVGLVVLCGVADTWQVDHPWLIAFLAVAAAIAAMQGVELGRDLHYDAADPLIVLAAIVGGPIAGALVGCASAATSAQGWRSRLGYASTRAAQGTLAGVAADAAGLGYGTTIDAVAVAAAAAAAGTLVVFAVTVSLARARVIELNRRVVVTNLVDPAIGAPLVAGVALGYAAAGAGVVFLLLVPSLLAATAIRLVREQWAALHAEAEARAQRDALTGAYNRRWFDAELERQLADGGAVGIVLLDLDHFKAVNDEHGHAAGDAVLVETVRRLSARVRAGDGVVRWGGEEFAVVLRGSADSADLAVRAEELRSAIGDHPFAVGGLEIEVTASAGAAALGEDVDTVIRAADAALYDAKRAGRNRAVLVAGA